MSYSLIYNLIGTRFVYSSKNKWTNTHKFTVWKHDINLESQTFCNFLNIPQVLEYSCYMNKALGKIIK